MNLELRDQVEGAITQSDLLQSKAEPVRDHTQLEENTYYKQRISELKEQLCRFAWLEKTLNDVLKETNGKLRKTNEELKYASSRLAEADQHAQEISDVLSQEIRDLKQRLEKSESSERALSIQLQQSLIDLKSTNKELERTQARLNEANERASEKDISHSQGISDLKKLLEKYQSSERALQHQLRQTQDDFKKITEEFEKTEIKFREKSKPKDVEFNPLLQQAHEQVNRITRELEDTRTRLNEVNQKAHVAENSFSREIRDLRDKINEFKLINERLNGKLLQKSEDLRKTTNDLEQARQRLIEANHRESETDKSTARDTSDLRKLLEKSELNERALKQQLRETKHNLKKMDEQFAEIKIKQHEALDGIRIQLKDKSQEVSDIRKMLDISKAKEATFNHQMQRQQDQLQKRTTELEDTKTRLSKLMGQHLTNNNPNITDLSEKNRPTKLSERFSELYENEWTDAFEVLGSIYKDERATVNTLITILKDADKYCKEEAEKQMERLRKDLTLNMEMEGGSDIPSFMNKQLKGFRKALATEAGQHLFEVYTTELSQRSSTSDSAKSALRVTAFLREAFMLCWLMSIQDPPVVFDRLLQHGEKFNTELYRSYTKSGPLVDFPVWPTMFLHEDGPVLYKGMAQGCHK